MVILIFDKSTKDSFYCWVLFLSWSDFCMVFSVSLDNEILSVFRVLYYLICCFIDWSSSISFSFSFSSSFSIVLSFYSVLFYFIFIYIFSSWICIYSCIIESSGYIFSYVNWIRLLFLLVFEVSLIILSSLFRFNSYKVSILGLMY